MLPGYVDKFTPSGIPNYTPSKIDKQIAKTVSQSFEYKPRAHLSYQIAGLFLMGSMGTIGQSNSSDIDLWVCLAEPIEAQLLDKLRSKGKKIKDWFIEVGVELNFYLVNLDDFSKNKSKQMSLDSCGNTQNYLLLDEFYRTAVWMAGRWPLWWMIPPGQSYQKYAKRLIEDKHLDSADWLDLGEVRTIPAAEYFSAALWQLFKAIDSPYKSSVKLLVLEVYAKLFPCGGVLSDDFKKRVYQQGFSNNEFDPYLLILEFAEEALAENPHRLEFLRRAFYLKTNVKISGKVKRKPNWRYQMVTQLVERWGWNQARLDYLNSRQRWTIRQVHEERKNLVHELTNSYHFLSNFARVQGVINRLAKSELLSLGRRLYAAFERRSGKIEQLNNGIGKDVFEGAITIRQHNGQNWQLYLGHIDKQQLVLNQPCYSGESLFECICWASVNQVIDGTTRFHIYQKGDYLNHQLVSDITRDLIELLHRFEQESANKEFEKEARITSLGIFINTRKDPLESERQENFYRVTNQASCFSWTDEKINLVDHFDVVFTNSWGEITTQYFTGANALAQFFQQHSHTLSRLVEAPPIYCRGISQKDEIVNAVKQLLETWKKLLAHSGRTQTVNRYVMVIGKKWLCVDLLNEEISTKSFLNASKFYNGLSENNYVDQPELKVKYHFDAALNINPFIKGVLCRRFSDSLDLYFYRKTRNSIEVVARSPSGCVHFQSHRNINIGQLIGHYQQFFDKIQNRNLLSCGQIETLRYYEFVQNKASGSTKISVLETPADSLYRKFSLVQAIATQKHVFSAGFDLFTDDQSFRYMDHGEGVYLRLRDQLLSKRKSGESYPIFLTDIDLSAIQEKVSIIEALGYKKMIESKLNKARSS
jgi:adenylate cyclase class 1